MVLYGESLSLLVEKIWGEYPVFLHSWYDDYFSTAGAGAHLKPTISHIQALGPTRELYLEPDKSQFV